MTDWVVVGDMRDDSAEILSRSFLQEALVSSSDMGRDVHSSTCPSSISFADCDFSHPLRCPEGRFLERKNEKKEKKKKKKLSCKVTDPIQVYVS